MPHTATGPKRKSIYSVHPGVLLTQKWIGELKRRTGRSLEEWLAFIKESGPKDEKARREWLKSEHGLGTNSASWLAERAEGKGTSDDDPERFVCGPNSKDCFPVERLARRRGHERRLGVDLTR